MMRTNRKSWNLLFRFADRQPLGSGSCDEDIRVRAYSDSRTAASAFREEIESFLSGVLEAECREEFFRRLLRSPNALESLASEIQHHR